MANTFTQLLYHVVFSTKERRPLLRTERMEELFRYIWGIHHKLKCHLYRINGVADHIHILTHIHPTVAVSKYIQTVKSASTTWINDEGVFPHWLGWQDGYAAFTHSIGEKERLTNYVKSQQEHHQKISYLDERKTLLAEAGLPFDEKYLS